MTTDRTTLIGSLALAFIVPIIAAVAIDPSFSRWAIVLNGVITGLNAVGNIFSRDNNKSDQQAGARQIDPATGTMTNASDIAAK